MIKRHASIYDKKEITTFSILKKGRNFGYVEEVIKTKRLKPHNILASQVLGKVDSYQKDKAYLNLARNKKQKVV